MNYNVARNCKRECLKSIRIGQSAALHLTSCNTLLNIFVIINARCYKMFTKNELYKLYVEEKKSQTEIARMYGCDKANVYYYLKKYDIPRRTQKENMKHNRKLKLTGYEIKNMVDNGMLIKEIAEKYGVSRSVVSSRLHECGLNLRNHKAARRKQSNFMKENNPFNDDEVKQKAINNTRKLKREQLKKIRKQNETFDETLDFKTYAKKARYLAYHYYGKGKDIPKDKVIDHIYSIKDGYKNKVPLSIISDPFNLRLVSREENIKKAFKSNISLEELYKGVVFND